MPENTRSESDAQEPGRKLPYMKFYPKDWRGDEQLRVCSLAARGLWIELLGIMHTADPRGYLIGPDGPYRIEALAALVGAQARDVRAGITELERNGVFSRTESGLIFSRKMVKDQRVSEAQRARILKRWHPEKSGETETGTPSGMNSGNTESIPYARERDRDSESQRLRALESDDSKGASSDQTKIRRAKMLDEFNPREFEEGDEWELGLGVLMIRGGKSERSARTLIGKIIRDFALRPAETAEAFVATWRNGTLAPEGYVRAVARRLVQDRGDGGRGCQEEPEDERPIEIERKWVAQYRERAASWDFRRGPPPGERFCKIRPEVQREFGFEVVT